MLKGISGYIYGLYLKKTFGVNEYRHWIKEVTVLTLRSFCKEVVIAAYTRKCYGVTELVHSDWSGLRIGGTRFSYK